MNNKSEKIQEVIKKYGLVPRQSVHFYPGSGLPSYLDSKIGGTPFLRSERDIPKKRGEYLKMLAQINMKDVKGLEGYPDTGILQFWIGDLNRTNFEVFDISYYTEEEINKGMSQDEVEDIYLNPDDTVGMYPMTGSFPLEPGEVKEEYMTNFAFDNLEEKYLDDDEVFSYFLKGLKGIKLGGYPFSYNCNECENACPLPEDYKALLLQMDSAEGEMGSLIWGNFGIGNVSISKEDLKNSNFENPYFYWDQAPDLEDDLDLEFDF